MIVVTGATGQLGMLVVEGLLEKVAAEEIVAAVRSPAKVRALAGRGVRVREADYSRPETLTAAFAGATKILLISGNELGQRGPQHRAVIEAAKTASVALLAYTSILHADTSTLALTAEHRTTEERLRGSGVPFVMLRNGWYAENLTAGIGPALEQGAFIGASKAGRLAAATRAEYAAAAVAVLTTGGHENKTYELAADVPFTRQELAAEVSRQSGKTVGYHDLPEAEYERVLGSFLPPELARVIADSEAKAASGELDDESHTLSGLLGRKTAALAEVVAEALRGV